MVPKVLRNYFQTYWDDQVFRRRIVHSLKTKSGKILRTCVTAYDPEVGLRERASVTLRYGEAILYEDWLTGKQCDEFAMQLSSGKTVQLEDVYLTPIKKSNQWSQERLPYLNHYMERAGHSISISVESGNGAQSSEPLLALNHPYYPDIYSAAADWLGLRKYHGDSDSRNEHATFLITKNRAYFASTEPVSNSKLHLKISGTELEAVELFVVGAAWVGSSIHQLKAGVSDRQATLEIPHLADRLELMLVDSTANVFDVHKEGLNWGDQERRYLAPFRSQAEDQVKNAADAGEGVHTEFKPFVVPEQKLYEPKTKAKTKLHEIITAVIAFSNSDGGCIYLGIDDDCQIVGVDHFLASWGEGKPDIALAERYAGAMRSAIIDNIEGAVQIQVRPVNTAAGIVIAIEVAQSVKRPVNMKDDHILYVRKGASNRKLAPSQWPEFQRAQTQEIFEESPFKGRPSI
jgi:hypothetical protein